MTATDHTIEAQISESRVTVRFSDLAPSAQIRATALRLFAENGVKATSLRSVAAEAGVSLGAVGHYFKSKADLENAVRADVSDQIRDAVHGVGTDLPPDRAPIARRAAYQDLLRRVPEIGAYVRRAITSSDEGSLEIFKVLYALARVEMGLMVEIGIARPMEDPDLELALYLLVVSASTLIGPHLEALFDLDLTEPADIERLQRAELNLLTKPVFPVAPLRP
jgi:AcrR family transcriptional regulator